MYPRRSAVVLLLLLQKGISFEIFPRPTVARRTSLVTAFATQDSNDAKTPDRRRFVSVAASSAIIGIFAYTFAQTFPENLCVTNGGFVASQLTNGIVIGIVYGLMALGLTLIYSILGVVSFAHGEFYMIGGMVVSTFLTLFLVPCVYTLVKREFQPETAAG